MLRRIVHAFAHLFGTYRYVSVVRKVEGNPVVGRECCDCGRFVAEVVGE